jgi:hypothetical protein
MRLMGPTRHQEKSRTNRPPREQGEPAPGAMPFAARHRPLLTIRPALLAGTPWLDVFCPGSGTRAGRSISGPSTVCPRCRHASARPTVLAVPVVGTDAEAARAVRAAAGAGRRRLRVRDALMK